ncbi:MAG: cytochrome b/b6 domain-containing protein [Shimia sp.]
MALANTHRHYGLVTKTFHWSIALLMLAVIPLGVIAHRMAIQLETAPDADLLARTAQLFSLHKTIGITIFALALLRIAWALSQPKPAPLHPERRAETFLANLVHFTLYGSLVLVPLTGWIHHAATEGFAPILYPIGQSLPLVPKDPIVAERFATLHLLFERVLIASILLHVAGALKHHVIDRDGTLRRMIGRPALPDLTKVGHGALPPVLALAIFAAVGIAGILQPVEARAPLGAALEAVSSEWRVGEGEVGITVTQLGSPVRGAFADWTAAIEFDEAAEGPVKGRVEAVIAIGSLTLGTVTDQALGPDFFDVGTFPTATFEGELREAGAAYVADGTLTIRDTTIPLELPFELDIQGDTAIMRGAVAVDRLDFGIGRTFPDESSLAFGVEIDIALTADRGTDAPGS